MVQSQFSLSWESYKSSLFSGFSLLQQNGEFVDMTLAADGHMVKVHQILVALASPYIKDLIGTAQCQHPVIFLNNVTHRNLCLLLEYIYTGEVVVPSDCFASFTETAKALHIRGLENVGTSENLPVNMSVTMPQFDDRDLCHISGTKTLLVPSSDKIEVDLPASAKKIFIKRDPTAANSYPTDTYAGDDINDFKDFDDSGAQDSDDGFVQDDNMDFSEQNTTTAKDKLQDSVVGLRKNSTRSTTRHKSAASDKLTSNLQFTVSIRGSLQVILNRYIYNLHSTTARSGVRRWRCVDYRNNKCTAFVVTKGNVVLNRANLHNHSFHDKKILVKIEKKAVFSAIDEVEGYKEREDDKMDSADITIENEGFGLVDEIEEKNESV